MHIGRNHSAWGLGVSDACTLGCVSALDVFSVKAITTSCCPPIGICWQCGVVACNRRGVCQQQTHHQCRAFIDAYTVSIVPMSNIFCIRTLAKVQGCVAMRQRFASPQAKAQSCGCTVADHDQSLRLGTLWCCQPFAAAATAACSGSSTGCLRPLSVGWPLRPYLLCNRC